MDGRFMVLNSRRGGLQNFMYRGDSYSIYTRTYPECCLIDGMDLRKIFQERGLLEEECVVILEHIIDAYMLGMHSGRDKVIAALHSSIDKACGITPAAQ